MIPEQPSLKRSSFTAFVIIVVILKLVCSFQAKKYIYVHITTSPFHSLFSGNKCRSIGSIKKHCNDCNTWDEDLQQEAAVALFPVFFPTESGGDGDGSSVIAPSRKPITAETALKRLLRKKYQRQTSNQLTSCVHRGTEKTIDESRGRLAELILGTSVMRLRHFVVTSAKDNSTYPLPYPLDLTDLPTHLERVVDDDKNLSLDSGGKKMILCLKMVQEHCTYLSSTTDSKLQMEYIQTLIGCDDMAFILAIHYSVPVFLASSLLSQYGHKTAKQILQLMDKEGPITIRKNSILFKQSDEELCDWLWRNDGVKASPMIDLLNSEIMKLCNYDIDEVKRYKDNARVMGDSILPPTGCICINPSRDGTRKKLPKSIWSMSSYQKGYFEVQDAGSQCIVQALGLMIASATKERQVSILDYCAGNGGKTFAIAAASDGSTDDAIIVSHDVVEERLRQIKGSLKRVGFKVAEADNVAVAEYRGDKFRCTLQTITSADLDNADTRFNIVLVDAPCSSSGVLRRRPSQRWLMREDETKVSLQLEIIQKAANFVKAGGVLLYATCSLLREENEEVIERFEKSDVFKCKGFRPWVFSEDDEDRTPGVGGGRGDHRITLLPTKLNDGFFFARYRRQD